VLASLAIILVLAAAQPLPASGCGPAAPAACSQEQLIFLLSSEGINRYWPDIDPVGVQEEAGKRVALEELLEALRRSHDSAQRQAITDILYSREDARIAATFRSLLGDGEDRAAYWMACYLAERGDERALAALNKSYHSWPVSSLEIATATRLFGDRFYYPAAPRLIDSLNAASLNLADAALKSLLKLYPGAKPDDIDSIAHAQSHFRNRAGKP
jgi:hypothetical protein